MEPIFILQILEPYIYHATMINSNNDKITLTNHLDEKKLAEIKFARHNAM